MKKDSIGKYVSFGAIIKQPYLLLLVLFLFFVNDISAQEKTKVVGTITNERGKPMYNATVAIVGTVIGVYSNEKGKFELEVPSDTSITVAVTYIGYIPQQKEVNVPFGKSLELTFKLSPSATTLNQFEKSEEGNRTRPMHKIDPRKAAILPSANGGGVEALIKTLPGVSSNNELSSQYNVRGGNFDENLVYVNDIEIYRPLLVRSGQQEGLSFINPDMVESIQFSAGGFDPKYGDKSASVLDIKYRKPNDFAVNVQASFLGASLHMEGLNRKSRISYQFGARQKSNQYLLGALETKGDYRPSFTDVQTFITFDATDKFDLSFLGNVSRNKFRMVPENRNTEFGHVNQALRLTVYFDGQEVSEFNTMMGALSGSWRPTENLNLKLIASTFNSRESERFDIQGQYWLDELERDPGSDGFGNKAFERGFGTFLNHARNQLDATVVNLEHRGSLLKNHREILWGIRAQSEHIQDKLKEWIMIDSAFYTIPRKPVDNILLQDVVRTNIELSSFRYNGFLQKTWLWYSLADTGNKKHEYALTIGSRANYWALNNQLIISPRANLAFKPAWNNDFLFRASIGAYHQPPFYRELRDLQGGLNLNIRAQNSYHFILASDYNFTAWNRPFKFVSELYYKYFDNLIPYEVDNVRVRYYAENNAKGFGTGIDLKINGEFVPGIDSWISLSLMKTMEDIKDDFYYDYFGIDGNKIHPVLVSTTEVADSVRVEPGYIPRPTDQRIMFGMFFQDYLPMLPFFKMHLNFLYGSRLPFGPPSHERFRDTLRMPPYRRVDIGFSYQIYNVEKRPKDNSMFKHLKDLWITAEVFNLLQVNNTISYLWIKDDQNITYAVPNYLTPRLINLRLVASF